MKVFKPRSIAKVFHQLIVKYEGLNNSFKKGNTAIRAWISKSPVINLYCILKKERKFWLKLH